jgi:hypothetical protein
MMAELAQKDAALADYQKTVLHVAQAISDNSDMDTKAWKQWALLILAKHAPDTQKEV